CIVVANFLKPMLWLKSAITIPMGVDLNLFKPMPEEEARKQLALRGGPMRVAFVAHPNNRRKRFDLAEAAVRSLQESGIEVELLPIYGVPHDQIPIYMNACNALVLTSNQEASPCVIKEAMACNLPIVSTDVGDVAEVIDGVENSSLCEPTSDDIAD